MPNLLKPEVKAAWLQKLRSGKYEQTTGVLCRNVDTAENKKHCCLGVLLDVVLPNEPWVPVRGDMRGTLAKTENGKYNVPLIGGLGFDATGLCCVADDDDTIDKLSKLFSILAERNDTGASFDEIADYIEENL